MKDRDREDDLPREREERDRDRERDYERENGTNGEERKGKCDTAIIVQIAGTDEHNNQRRRSPSCARRLGHRGVKGQADSMLEELPDAYMAI